MKISEIITEGWSKKYKRSIDCSHPKGFSQRAHCQGRKKNNESVAEARSPEEFMRQMGKIVTTPQTFEVGDWVTIDPNETEGYASSGMTGVITKLYTDDEGESMAQVNIGGAGGVQTKMKTHGRVFGPPGTTLDLGKGIRSYGTATVVPTSLLQKHDPQGVAEGLLAEASSDEAWELVGQPVTEIQQFVKQMGYGNDEQSVAKITAIIDKAASTQIPAASIPKLKNLANKGSDIQTLKAVQQISGRPDAEQQYTKLMQARDAGEGRRRDVSGYLQYVKSGNYDPPVLLKLPTGIYVIGGRTRLYAALALGVPANVKIISANSFKQGVAEDSMSLHDWFGKGKHGGAGGGGWDRYNTKGERIGKCGERSSDEGKPKCLSKSKAASLRASGGKKAIAAAVNKKRRNDSNPDRRGAAINVSSKKAK